MTPPVILIIIGATCLLLNIIYIANHKNTDEGIAIASIFLAPFVTLGYMILTCNALIAKGRMY